MSLYLRINNKNLEEYHNIRKGLKFNFLKIASQQAKCLNFDFRIIFENFKPKINYYNGYFQRETILYIYRRSIEKKMYKFFGFHFEVKKTHAFCFR